MEEKEMSFSDIFIIPGDITTNLDDILNRSNTKLLEFMYEHLVDSNILDNRKQLIKSVKERLLDKKNIESILSRLTKNEYDEVMKHYNTEDTLEDESIISVHNMGFYTSGLLFKFMVADKIVSIMASEVKDIIKSIDLKQIEDTVTYNSKIDLVSQSLINYYGIMPCGTFFEMLIDYLDADDSVIDKFMNLMEFYRFNYIARYVNNDENGFFLRDEYNADYYINIINKIIDLSFNQDEYKDLPYDELIKYYNRYYYDEIDSITVLKKYLKKSDIDKDCIEDVVREIVLALKFDYFDTLTFVKNVFHDCGLDIDENNIDEILSYISEVYNNLPLFGNNGFTNKELVLNQELICDCMDFD